jgi:hypothetical protein
VATWVARVGQGLVELDELAAHELKDVGTRAAAGPSHLDDVLDLVEMEPEPPGARHERENL